MVMMVVDTTMVQNFRANQLLGVLGGGEVARRSELAKESSILPFFKAAWKKACPIRPQ